MSKHARFIVVAIPCVIVGGLIGFLIGAGYSGSRMKGYMMDSNATWLANHIHRLAMIRTGRASDCVTDIERTLDNCIVQLSSNGFDREGRFHPTRIPQYHCRALRIARMYSDAGFDGAFSKESLQVLAAVEPPPADAEYCSPALREMQKPAPGKSREITQQSAPADTDTPRP